MTMYSSGISLGPHEEESRPSRPPLRAKLREAEQVLARPYQIPAALILIAVVSFGANFAFGYLSLVKQGLEPEIASADAPRGSDDRVASFVPPTFASSTHFTAIENPAPLKLSAEGYLVADADTGEIILEKNADTPYPIASVTKMMTAIVAKEQMDLHHPATVTDNSYNAYGTEGGLARGEKILVADLFYPLLIESSNDAAEVLADDFGRDNFLALLNQKASMLGMASTHYDDPSGLSPTNVSTAHDLTKLALYMRQSYPELLDITRVKQYSIFEHSWKNENYFLTYPNFLGGKNGFINEAKKTTVSYFKVFFRGEASTSKAVDRPVVIVLLRSDDRNKDAALLLTYISKNIRYVSDPEE
jgi:D-alanyl-D-alanine carboxypeptidase